MLFLDQVPTPPEGYTIRGAYIIDDSKKHPPLRFIYNSWFSNCTDSIRGTLINNTVEMYRTLEISNKILLLVALGFNSNEDDDYSYLSSDVLCYYYCNKTNEWNDFKGAFSEIGRRILYGVALKG